MENVQLGHWGLEILNLQIAADGNGLTTSRIFPKERRQILESEHRWIHPHHGLRLGGGGADDWLPQVALQTEMIAGGDVDGETLPTGVTLVDLLIINFAMTEGMRNILI